jgi:hypothetical protein
VIGCGTDTGPTTLTGVDSGWRRRAEPLLLEIGAHLQIGVNGLDQAQTEVRVLAVSEDAPASSISRSSNACSLGRALAQLPVLAQHRC